MICPVELITSSFPFEAGSFFHSGEHLDWVIAGGIRSWFEYDYAYAVVFLWAKEDR